LGGVVCAVLRLVRLRLGSCWHLCGSSRRGIALRSKRPEASAARMARLFVALGAAASWLLHAGAQMQFEIPAEMLQGMMGGMMGGGMGGGQQPKMTEWPKTENANVAPEFEWIINTEWKGKTAKYLFLRDGIIESPLKECEREGMCLWAANNGKVAINTPTLKVVKFVVDGLKQADRKKLENKDKEEFKKVTLVSEKPSKSGKKSELKFERVAEADASDSIPARDLYEVLELKEDATQSEIKSKFRRLSVTHHPDKQGGDPTKFNEIREAYEMLGDQEMRRFYDMGGAQLCKNVENLYKEAEGQMAQVESQLSRIPKGHPQRAMFEAQIEQQKSQFDKSNPGFKHEMEKKLRNDELDVMVPVSAQELYNGVPKKKFEFKRLVLCRGCRADPDAPQCKECGRCPPEKVQVPKYGMTPFGRQVVGVKEKEQESRERCREVLVPIEGLRIPKGAKGGATLKSVADIGHQTPGKIPGRVIFKVQRGSPQDTYTIEEADLYTVLHLSLQQALFGFSLSWTHLGDETVTLSRDRVTSPDEVVRLPKKGLVASGSRGDLFVRLAVTMPNITKGTKSLALEAPENKKATPQLIKEDEVRLQDGAAFRRWAGREKAKSIKVKKDKDKEEL